MTTYAWPQAPANKWHLFMPSTIMLRQRHNNIVHESPQSGAVQVISTPGSKWGWVFDLTPHRKEDRPFVEAFLTRLAGREHRVTVHDMRRPVPQGTINTSGVTCGTHAAFAQVITLNGCGNARTLFAGDWLGLANGQLVMVVPDLSNNFSYTATSGGVITPVYITPMLRSPLTSGQAVTLNKPTATYQLAETMMDYPRQSGFSEPPLSIELVETF